jgi:cell wall-associated NlpC family hydrolase
VRTRLLLLIPLAAVALLAAEAARAAPAPGERVQQARAQQVLAQIDALDVRLDHVVDAWNGANIRLAALDGQVRQNRIALRRARRTMHVARRRLAQRLVDIYVSGEPGLMDVLAGAHSLSDVVDRAEAAKAISAQDKRIADVALAATQRTAHRQRALVQSRARQRRTLSELDGNRSQIESSLGERRTLLASIQTEIARLQAQERERERRLAAEARARIARQQRLLAARARQAARQRAAAEKQAQTPAQTTAQPQPQPPPPAPPPPPAAPPAPSPTTTEATTTTEPAPAAPAPPPPPAPAPVGGGHPEAAAIAARYLGVPYRWGGATPSGFDCSGLVAYVYAQIGISLPHYSEAQFHIGAPVSRDALQPGDLVFFNGASHVGIYIGGGQFIHAPHTGDVVKVSSLSEAGYASGYDGARRP